MSMKKKNLIALIVIAVIAVLLTIGFLLSELLHKEDTPPDDLVSAQFVYEAFSADAGSCSMLSWSHSDQSFTLTRTTNGWSWTDDPEMPVSTEQVSSLLVPLTSVKAKKRYTDTTEQAREDYGLSEPAISVTVTDAAYGSHTLRIGIYSSAAGGYYASLATDPETVYVIGQTVPDLYGTVTCSALLATEQYPCPSLTAKTLDGFDLILKDSTYRFQYDLDGIPSDDNSRLYHWYVSVNGAANRPVDTDSDALCEWLVGCEYTELVNWHSSSLAEYGIDEESPRLTVHYTVTKTVATAEGTEYIKQAHSCDFRFGTQTPDNVDCVCPDGTSLVYTLKRTGLLRYLQAVAEDCSANP